LALLNRDDLIVKGAQARLHELLAEVRELLVAFEQLPRTITVSLNETAPRPRKSGSNPARAADYAKRMQKRRQTMLARYGTANPRLIKQRKAEQQG